MTQPKMFSEAGWNQSMVELAVLYALTTVVAVLYLDVHALIAMALSPVVMVAMLLGVALIVQVLWMVVLGMEKAGTFVGFRKSPLV